VKQLLAACGRLAGAPVPHVVSEPRPGDPAILVADIAHARAELGWSPRRSLDDILAAAWAWHARGGYQDAAPPGALFAAG
jgi:UDP-glucose 4-epimerase